MTNRKAHSDMSIEDILESIRNVINARAKSPHMGEAIEDCEQEDDEAIEDDELHLVNIKQDDLEQPESSILSEESSARSKAILEDFVETASNLGHNINRPEEQTSTNNKTIENFLLEMLRPGLKEWLDANLPLVVRQVVSEEIKKLVANMNRS